MKVKDNHNINYDNTINKIILSTMKMMIVIVTAIAIAAVAAGLAAIAVYASGWGVKTGPQNNPVTYDPMKFNKERSFWG